MKKRRLTLILLVVLVMITSSIPLYGQDDDEGAWEYISYQYINSTTIIIYPTFDYLTDLLHSSCAELTNDSQVTACHLNVLGTMGWELVAIDAGTFFFKRPAQPQAEAAVTSLAVEQGFGAEKGLWQVYFTAPTGSSDSDTYVGGIDDHLLVAIGAVESTLDIAAFEWNNPWLTDAVIAAHERGVQVRMVVDNEHTLEDNQELIEEGEDSPFQLILDAGIPIVDDDRSGLMHNKFMVMDGATVWLGSMNYTVNGTYRNNNNMLVLRSTEAATSYTGEFEEMFTGGEFSKRDSEVNGVQFTSDDTDVAIYFSPEDEPVPALLDAINNAQSSVHFVTFSFTLDEVGDALLERAAAGVDVAGVFETRGSETQYSELPKLFCSKLNVYQDGNPYTMHHKVFIIDKEIVVTGSFNISANATESNDENMVVVRDADLAAQYLAEFERLKANAAAPEEDEITCP